VSPYRRPGVRLDHDDRPGWASVVASFVAAVMVLAVAYLSGCGWFQGHGATAITDAAAIAACVVQHDNEPPAQIALTCGLANAQAVIDLIATVDRRAAKRFSCIGAQDAGADR
jgi:hypothetical protein